MRRDTGRQFTSGRSPRTGAGRRRKLIAERGSGRIRVIIQERIVRDALLWLRIAIRS